MHVAHTGHNLVMNSDIMHIVAYDKGKPAVKRGRKTTDPG